MRGGGGAGEAGRIHVRSRDAAALRWVTLEASMRALPVHRSAAPLFFLLAVGCGGSGGGGPGGPPYEPPAVALDLGVPDDDQSYGFGASPSILSTVDLREGGPAGRLHLDLGYRSLFAYSVHMCAEATPRTFSQCSLLSNGDFVLAPAAFTLAFDADDDGLRDDVALVLYNSFPALGFVVVNAEQQRATGLANIPGVEVAGTVGHAPTGACVGDFDGNGSEDVAFTVREAGRVGFTLTTPGVGIDAPVTFQPPETLTIAGALPTDVVAVDVDGDGRDELAALDTATGGVLLARRAADGTLEAFGTPPAGVGGAAGPLTILVAGDFDGDGRDDLAGQQEVGGVRRFVVLRSRGDGSFDAPRATETPGTAGYVASRGTVGDVNGDGRLDVAWVATNDYRLAVLLGRGDGTFVEATPSSVLTAPSPTDVAIGDIDADGFADLAVACAGPGRVDIYWGRAP